MSENIATPAFSELGLSENLTKALAELGFAHSTEVQAESIPHLLQGRDILAQAKTGTGKTAAFALPILDRLDLDDKTTQVLVLTPTRELAIQVSKAFEDFSKYLNKISIHAIYGGQSYNTQLRALKKGVQIVIGTPGRVIDHIKRGTLDISALRNVVLDEADEMLRMGFIDDVEWILSHTPESKQVALFSATLPREIQKITKNYLTNEVSIQIKSKTKTASTIRQSFLRVKAHDKPAMLNRLLECIEFDAVIIFAKTRSGTLEITEELVSQGYACAAINGDLQQAQREKTIEQLKKGKLDILVATDVAARGLDVERITHVINYDAPQDAETYIHRIGRTGRAGRQGDAILFLPLRDRRLLSSITRTTQSDIEAYQMPSVDAINEQRINKFKSQILGTLEKPSNAQFESMIVDLHKETEIDIFKIAAALASLPAPSSPFLLSENDMLSNAANERGDDREGGRGKRGEGKRRERGERKDKRDLMPLEEMEWYRIEVGHKHRVKPGNIVGAIANEAGLEGNNIGPIEIYDDHSVVALPKGMPKAIFNHLKKTHVLEQKLNISLVKPGDKPTGDKSGGRGAKPQATDGKNSKPKRQRKTASASRSSSKRASKPAASRSSQDKPVRKRKVASK